TIKTATTANPTTRMPTIDKLAASGVTFVNAWSSPVCSPSRACLFTGMHSFRHGVYSPTVAGAVLPTEIVVGGTKTTTTTIAKVLSGSCYSSGLFGKWHLGEDYVDGSNYGPIYFGWNHFAGALGGALSSYTDWKKVED